VVEHWTISHHARHEQGVRGTYDLSRSKESSEPFPNERLAVDYTALMVLYEGGFGVLVWVTSEKTTVINGDSGICIDAVNTSETREASATLN
jgi:hypothetical protein